MWTTINTMQKPSSQYQVVSEARRVVERPGPLQQELTVLMATLEMTLLVTLRVTMPHQLRAPASYQSDLHEYVTVNAAY